MRIIEIAPLDNGAHRNQSSTEDVALPEGWAVIPEGMEIPDTYPFVGVEAEDGIVTALTPGVLPPPSPKPEAMYTVEDMIYALTGG